MTGTQTYNAEALAKLKSWLGTMAEKGHKKFFEIFVDNARVVHKTDSLGDFDDHEMWVDDKTKVIRVLVYNTEGSHRYQPFEYRTENYLNELDLAKQKSELQLQQSLSGLDVDSKIDMALTKQKQEFFYDSLKKENIALKEQLKESEEYADELLEKVNLYESQKFKLTQDSIISVGSGILSYVVKANPDIIKKIPAGALNGISAFMASSSGTEKIEPETEVSFRKKAGQDKEAEEEEDEDTQIKMAFIEQMQQKLDDDELKKVFGMMYYLMENPEQIDAVFELVIPAAYKPAA